MVEGFACTRCDQLFEERPGSCPACGHEGMEPLTFSDYRRRLRAGEEPGVESRSRSRIQTAVLLILAIGLIGVGLAAVGMGATAMAF